jgi:guanylate kinase
MLNPYLFLIVGASGSGKGTLLRALKDMGDRYVTVISKITTRPPKATDGDELISINPAPTAIQKTQKDFEIKYDIVYGQYKYHYGISTSDILQNFKKGKFQVLIVSNSDAIKKLYQKFEPIIKLIYLYSPIDVEKLEAHQINIGTESPEEIEKRKKGIEEIHKFYITNISRFDHVFLNIREPEDMFDQIFRLFKRYRNL